MFVIKREVGGMPEYLTLDKDYSLGSQVAWSADSKIALSFADARSAKDFKSKFHREFDWRASVLEL